MLNRASRRLVGKFGASASAAAQLRNLRPSSSAAVTKTAGLDALRSTDSFARSLSKVLALMGERGMWNYAEAWIPNETSGALVCRSTWADDSFHAVEEFRQAAMSIQLTKGRGEVGRVWDSEQAHWVPELKFSGRARLNAAEGAGLKSGLVVPIKQGDDVMAVLHFYANRQVNENSDMMSDFVTTGSMLLASQLDATVRPVLRVNLAEQNSALTQQLMDKVFDRVTELGAYDATVVYEDLDWYFNHMGLPNAYFQRFNFNQIARHVAAYISAKKLASVVDGATHDSMRNDIETTVQSPTNLVIMRPAHRDAIMEVEALIDDIRDRCRAENRCLNIARFRTSNTSLPFGDSQLMVWIIDNEPYVEPDSPLMETDALKLTSSGHQERSKHIFAQFQKYVTQKQERLSPLIMRLDPVEDGCIPIVIGMRSTVDRDASSPSRGFNRLITELLGSDLVARRKFGVTTSNGLVFHNLYLDPAPDARVEEFLDDMRLISILPKSNLESMLTTRQVNAAVYAYANCAANFIYYFMSDNNEDLKLLRDTLSSDTTNAARLDRIALTMQREAITPMRIEETLRAYPELMQEFYDNFAASFDPEGPCEAPAYSDELAARIDRDVPDEFERRILKTALIFNSKLLKTNFFKDRKSSLSFRIDPSFIADDDRFVETPYGLFMLMGNDFRGFHVRFRDVARGGIRLINSRDNASYSSNRQTLFAENYGLAHTQNSKNKDIPEFGSKGTILLERNSQNAGEQAFNKYISGIFDLLLPVEGEIVDHHGREEILFLGPDEGTADVMEWACDYANHRGYPYWKSITTGKPPSMGGIPHDTYGMTTLSVHQFALGVLNKLDIPEETVTKLQTGGPDGDLGSNEILISKDRTTSVVDGAGIVHDPDGLDRAELERLASMRVMIDEFDGSKLGPNGFKVLVGDSDVTLPSGEVVNSGLNLRNNFHLHPSAQADLFVPCGGRPESINASNVHELTNEDGSLRFKYIVEGANLFVTEDARGTLESQGVVLFKDASTNKGGVTCSSMEVLAALALNDAEFDQHMRVPDGGEAPDFYKTYVDEIMSIVKNNADLEFEALWEEHARTGINRHLLTDQLSGRINELNIAVQSSTLWENQDIRRRVLREAFPKTLQNLVGLDELMERLPEHYQQAVFGYYVASRYVYKHGLSGQEFAFFEYMNSYTGPEE